MELHITEVKPPREGKKAYIVKASNGVDYFCSKGGGALRPDTTITAEVTVQEYSGKTYNWIKSYTPSNDVEKTGTKPEDWDIALRWYFDNLKAGVLETDKRLNGGQEVL